LRPELYHSGLIIKRVLRKIQVNQSYAFYFHAKRGILRFDVIFEGCDMDICTFENPSIRRLRAG
jgi:hypothetical protein